MNTRVFPLLSIAAASVLLMPSTASARGGHHHDSHTHHHLRGPSHAHWSHPHSWPGSLRYRPYRRPAVSLPARVQSPLASRGYYRGPIDGIAGGGSARALRAFQHAAGLPVSGRTDRATIARLGLN